MHPRYPYRFQMAAITETGSKSSNSRAAAIPTTSRRSARHPLGWRAGPLYGGLAWVIWLPLSASWSGASTGHGWSGPPTRCPADALPCRPSAQAGPDPGGLDRLLMWAAHHLAVRMRRRHLRAGVPRRVQPARRAGAGAIRGSPTATPSRPSATPDRHCDLRFRLPPVSRQLADSDRMEFGATRHGECRIRIEQCRADACHPARKVRTPTKRNGRASLSISGTPRCVVEFESSPVSHLPRGVRPAVTRLRDSAAG